MQATKLADAEKAYQEAVKLAPNDPRMHIALGNLYVFEHKPGDAQIEFMKVLEIDPKNAATHVALGNLYSDQNQRGLAENQYRAAVALEPDRYNYHLDLGEVLRQEGKIAAAEDQIRTAIGLNPKDAKAHLALANLLAREPGRATEANAEFDEVRALDAKLMPAPARRPLPRSAPAETPGTRRPRPRRQPAARAADQAAQQTLPVDEKFAGLSESRRPARPSARCGARSTFTSPESPATICRSDSRTARSASSQWPPRSRLPARRCRSIWASDSAMPELSRFFGIVVRMFYSDHEPAHFHAIYGEFEVLIEVETLSSIPRVVAASRARAGS